MLLHLLNPELLTLVVNRLETREQAGPRLVCKSFHAAVGDYKKKVAAAIKRFTQIQRLTPSSVRLHTRLGEHTVEFDPINPDTRYTAREYVVHVNQQRFIGRVSTAHVDNIDRHIAVLWARHGFHISTNNETWIHDINTDLNGRITSVSTTFACGGEKFVVQFDLRDQE